MAQEADLGVRQIDSGGGLEQLDHGGVAVDLQHLAPADGAVVELDFHQLVVGDALHLADHHQRADDFFYSAVFLDHQSSPPCSATAWISAAMPVRMSS